tara:strand:- start:1679 stop:2731 length:1053 start_codon:yes stop_codon:yes gene_type:complete
MSSFVRFANTDIVNDTARITTSTWTGNTNELTAVHTSSLQAVFGSPTSSGAHFIEVHDKATSDATAEVQYSVAYGHVGGSGSLDFTNAVGSKGLSPTRNIYSQYRQLVFGTEGQNFTFTDHTPDDIYVININRSRYKHNLKPGSLNLKFGSGSIKINLTDDSITATGSSTITNAGRQFNIVSGSNGVRKGASTVQITNSGSYGFFYPDSGFIILNPDALDHDLKKKNSGGGNFGDVVPGIGSNTEDKNHEKLSNAIIQGASFIVDSEEKVSSTYYFARARNFEYNYTTNPSFTDSNGNVLINSMIDNPTTYITTVGMYNEEGDLLAVAKLSQPITKDCTKEALIRVKLDY